MPDSEPGRLTLDAALLEGAVEALSEADGIAIDLRYASTNNVLGRNIYGAFCDLYLHRIAAAKLRRAVALLGARCASAKIVVFDGLRPIQAQQAFWDHVKHGPMRHYVADPAIGSIHNYGFSVDCSLRDAAGAEYDMGTAFDDFTPLSEPRFEDRFLAEGRLTAVQIANRRLLRSVMEDVGFQHLPLEWWHFDAEPPDLVRQAFVRLA